MVANTASSLVIAPVGDHQAERRVYENDPIQEALCEVRFRSPKEGWAVLPGRLFERLTDLYPADPTSDLPFGGMMGPQAGQGIQISFGQASSALVRLTDEDNTRGLMIGPGVLTVFVRRPYPRWERFSEQIVAVLSAFAEVAGTFEVDRIGLRYINQIEVPDNPVQIERYFAVQPLQFPGLNLSLRGFLGRSEQHLDDNPDRLVIATFASGQPQQGSAAFILDLDVIAQNLRGIGDIPAIKEVVRELRGLEKTVFEASITDHARLVFGDYEVREESGAF